jgi:hypothetical protein
MCSCILETWRLGSGLELVLLLGLIVRIGVRFRVNVGIRVRVRVRISPPTGFHSGS